jgi:hypothetical protein
LRVMERARGRKLLGVAVRPNCASRCMTDYASTVELYSASLIAFRGANIVIGCLKLAADPVARRGRCLLLCLCLRAEAAGKGVVRG